jgi:hypothetical protein
MSNIWGTQDGFGGISQPNAAAATAAVPWLASDTTDNPVGPCPKGSRTAHIAGQPVLLCGPGSPETVPAVSWDDGDWHFAIGEGSGLTWQERALPIITELHQVRMPTGPGWLFVDVAQDGEHTTAAWATGRYDYTVYDYHFPWRAVETIASMQPWEPRHDMPWER